MASTTFVPQVTKIESTWLNEVNRAVYTQNIAGLRLLVGTAGAVAAVHGYYTSADGGGGMFNWDSASTASDDGGLTILPTGHVGAGRWRRMYSGPLCVEQYGAKGDNIQDDAPFIVAAIASGQSINGTRGRTYRINSGLTFSNRYQMFDLNGSTLAPNGTFNPAINITQVDTGITNGEINGINHVGSIISNPSEIQHVEMDRLTIINSSAGNAAVLLKDVYTSNFHKIRITNHRGTAFQAYTSVSGQPINSMWFDHFDVSGGTSTADSIVLEGATAVHLMNVSCQNNATGSTDIRIKSTVNAGVTAVTVKDSYFETGINHTGNCIHIGDPSSGSNAHVHVKVDNTYFQVSKQPIRIGTIVNDDSTVSNCTFNNVTGSPTYAIVVSGSANPQIKNCSGSMTPLATGSLNRVKLGEVSIYSGSGTPEGVVSAVVGSLYLRTNTSTTIVYFKTSGTGNTGWASNIVDLTTSGTMSFGTVPANSTVEIGMPFAGTTLAMNVAGNLTDAAPAGIVVSHSYISPAGTVNMRVANITGASIAVGGLGVAFRARAT